MGLFLIFIVMIAVIVGFFFFLGRNTAKSQDSYLKRHPLIAKIVLSVYVISAGCFVFPIRSEQTLLDFMKIYLLLVSYGIAGLGFAGIYGTKKEKVVYPVVLALTVVGMVCRYLLEYEVSNAGNFTTGNIIAYIAIIPAFTVLTYHFIVKYLVSKK